VLFRLYMVMESALETLGYDTSSGWTEEMLVLMSKAWDRAKKLQFNPENVNGCDCLGSCECLPIPSDHKVFEVSA